MGVEVEQPLRLRWGVGRMVSPRAKVKPRPKSSLNAQLAIGLWMLLWLGYNTNFGYFLSPRFSVRPTYFIHGVRAFFPGLAGWIAFVIIFARSKRVFSWIVGPLGLMLLYAIFGLVSSAAYSPDPTGALYMGINYLALVLVMLAIVPVDDPLPDLRRVLNFTWNVGFVLTLSLLGAIPFLGSAALMQTETNPVGVRAYAGETEILGMPSTRNTGFARYAAISALVAIPRLMKKGNLVVRIIWGVILAGSLSGLVMANGRTETLAFVASLAVVLGMEKAKRTVNFLVATGALILLGLRGFFAGFYLYITRTGEIDPTMTGRTETWERGWRYLWDSPWIGFGFQGDRYLLHLEHMHNAFLHSLFQSGFLGWGAIIIGIAIVWAYMLKYFFFQQPSDKSLIPPEVPAVFLFVTISSLAESTFAYFSAAWLLSAPIVPYVMALHRKVVRTSAIAARERAVRSQLARYSRRFLADPPDEPTPTAR